MNKRDWYYKQLVSQADMDEAFDWVESSIWELALDNRMWGVHDGLDVAENAPVDLNVLISGGSASGKDGERIYTAASSTLLDCSVDEYGVSTAVTVPGEERIVSVFVRFLRDTIDPEVDGNGLTVYTRQVEDLEFFVRQGAQSLPPATPPSVLPEALLLADITLSFGQTSIQNVHLDVTRREDWLRYAGTTFSLVAGTPHEALIQSVADGLLEAFDKHVSDTAYPHSGGSIGFSFSEQWYGPQPVSGSGLPPATVADALDAIVYDLAQTGFAPATGASRIGAGDSPPWTYVTPWLSADIDSVLISVAGDLDNHIGGALPQHPATAITFTPYSWLASTAVQAVIQEIVDDLGSVAAGSSGASRIGTESIAGSPESIAASDVMAVLTAVYGHLNARTERVVDETITGRWSFEDMTYQNKKGGTQVVKTAFGGTMPPDSNLADIAMNRTWGTRGNWAHAWADANNHVCANPPTDICCCPYQDRKMHVLAMVPSTATVEIVDATDISITDIADISVTGAPTPTAMCCNGTTVFVMYDNDTVYAWTFSPTPGGGAWSSPWGPVALPAGASGSWDRIKVVDDTYIMTANSGLAQASGTMFTRIRMTDGGGVLSGVGSASAGAGNYPAGGVASCGTTWCATAFDGANTELIEIDPATMGDPAQFISGNPVRGGAAETWRDIVCDGQMIWVADYLSAPGRIHLYPCEVDSVNTRYDAYVWGTGHYSRNLVFDGLNIWATNHTTGSSPNGCEIQGIPVCRENWAAPQTTGINAQTTPPWVNVLTPNPGKMAFDGDGIWCIQDEGYTGIVRVPRSTVRC